MCQRHLTALFLIEWTNYWKYSRLSLWIKWHESRILIEFFYKEGPSFNLQIRRRSPKIQIPSLYFVFKFLTRCITYELLAALQLLFTLKSFRWMLFSCRCDMGGTHLKLYHITETTANFCILPYLFVFRTSHLPWLTAFKLLAARTSQSLSFSLS